VDLVVEMKVDFLVVLMVDFLVVQSFILVKVMQRIYLKVSLGVPLHSGSLEMMMMIFLLVEVEVVDFLWECL